MAILRHRRRDNFTIIPNDIFKSGLSLKACGLLCFLLSLPDGWSFSVAGICAKLPSDGKDSIKKGLSELENAHFLVRTQQRTTTGRLNGFDWVVSDEPLTRNPLAENPSTGNPSTGNPSQLNNQLSKNTRNKESNGEGRTPTRSRFTPPSVEEVRAYCAERRNNIDPQRFVDYYSASGWKRGKTPIKDWKACVRTWERGESSKRQNNAPDYSAYQEESL